MGGRGGPSADCQPAPLNQCRRSGPERFSLVAPGLRSWGDPVPLTEPLCSLSCPSSGARGDESCWRMRQERHAVFDRLSLQTQSDEFKTDTRRADGQELASHSLCSRRPTRRPATYELMS